MAAPAAQSEYRGRRECAQAVTCVRTAAGTVCETADRLAKHRSAARGRAAAAAAGRGAAAAVVRAAGWTGEAAATSGAAARGGQRRGAGERGARAMSEGRRREMEGGGDGGEGRGGGGGGGGENGGTEFVSVSGAAAGGGAARRSRCLSDVLSLGSHATATGVPGSRDRARAAFTTRARSSRSRVPRGKRSFRPTSSGAQGSRRSAGGVALHGPAGCSGEGRRARTSTESLRAAGGARARARRLSAG